MGSCSSWLKSWSCLDLSICPGFPTPERAGRVGPKAGQTQLCHGLPQQGEANTETDCPDPPQANAIHPDDTFLLSLQVLAR